MSHEMATRGPSIVYKLTVKRKKYRDGKGKKEDKVAPIHAMKACRGSRGKAPLVLNLGAR